MKKIKRYILERLSILKLKEESAENIRINQNLQKQVSSLEKQVNTLRKQVYVLQCEKEELMGRVDDLDLLTVMHWNALNQMERKPRIIVSLTSFPARINYAANVLGNMLLQTVRPDKVILYLSKEQFPNREADLPRNLLKMKEYGIEIKWCDGDIKAYKKFLPAMKEYPDDLLIILDDDLVYGPEMIEKLYEAHKAFPDAIIASRCHEIGMDENDKIRSYKTWKKQCGHDTYQLKDDWFFTGGAGTLFPPHIFGEEIYDLDTIQEICPWADDIWLNIHAAINRVPIINTAANNILTRIEATQGNRLQDINLDQNDIQLKAVTAHYKEKLAGTIYEKM